MNFSAEEIHIYFVSYANIPFKAGMYANDLTIEWGDGTISTLQDEQYFNIEHYYQQEGLFKIKILGHQISNLNISRLSLTDILLKHCPALEYLNCSVNELKELNLSQCPVLEELQCNSNNLQTLDLSLNPELIELNTSYNLLETLTLSSCTKLQTLHCSFNRLSSIQLNNCTSILNIDLCNNSLKKEKLDQLFHQLPHQAQRGMIYYLENPGSELSDFRILQMKNWD